MLHLAQTMTSPNLPAFAATRAQTDSTQGQRIRFAAADLFRQGRVAEADLLTQEAMQQYPDSEDVLVIRALICEVRQDWHGATKALERLLALQGKHAPVESWTHWLRVLRCDGQLQRAFDSATQALQHHPAHPAIASELAQLEMLGVSAQPKAA